MAGKFRRRIMGYRHMRLKGQVCRTGRRWMWGWLARVGDWLARG